ncbi:MAG: hypothetical protein PHC83_01365, partial [Bacteroidales bacterium]|nr:hypothetical protein [Bacteroidales bacterium]
TETLVRMASMSELTMDNFKEVVAVSSEQQAINMLLNCSSGGVISKLFSVASSGIPCSFILPEAIILSDIEIKKDKNVILQKEYITPNPLSE